MLLSFMAFVQSCSKDQIDNKNDNTSINKRSLRLEGDAAIKLINDFINKLDNPSGVAPMNIEDVVWNIEATLNYKYGYTEKVNYINYHSGDTSQVYTLENGEMEFSQVKALYDGFKGNLSSVYESIGSEDKWLLLVDIDIDEDSNLKMFYAFGENQTTLEKQAPAWSSWYYGEDLGMCNGGGIPSDAANEIDKELRADFIAHAQSVHAYTPNYHWIPTAVAYPGPSIPGGFPGPVGLLNTNDITPQDNQLDYILFHSYSAWPNHHTCLNPTEMDFYYNGPVYIISTLEAYYPSKEVVFSKLSDASSAAGSYVVKYHGLDVRFGHWLKVSDINTNTYTL